MITLKEKYDLDRQAQLDYAWEEGYKKGYEQGKALAIYQVYQAGYNIETIAEYLKMDTAEIQHYINPAKDIEA